MRTLSWHRSDLRTIDCAPLLAAAESGEVVHACVILSPGQWRLHDWGANRVEYMRRNIAAFSESLSRLNIPLHIRTADTFEHVPGVLGDLVRELEIDAVHWGCEYEINERDRDHRCRAVLEKIGVRVFEHHDQVILDPDRPRTGEGRAYRVFTPYRGAWLREVAEQRDGDAVRIRPAAQPVMPMPSDPVPEAIEGFTDFVDLDRWAVGEDAAIERLDRFIADQADRYAKDRDAPAVAGTSELGPALAVGALSPWTSFRAAGGAIVDGRQLTGRETWISEICWREFYRHVLVHHPHVGRGRNFDRSRDQLQWRNDESEFQAWCEGRTGIPIVDAAMRCLVATGWMHNRLRMVVSQFLSKNLFIDWRWGEAFFARHLVDLDFASNNGGWQWSASTGTDAAPYFRVFNPVRQGQKHDPDGAFTRRWLPELASIPDRDLHEPWLRHGLALSAVDYPDPIVDLSSSRRRAIEAFKADGMRSADRA